jgi:hypothetical protein
MLLLSILSELFDFLSGSMFLDSDPYTQQAIAPLLAVGAAAGIAQTGMGIYQTIKGQDDSAEKKAAMEKKLALANMAKNQQKLIDRTKQRAALGGEMPGQSIAESKLGANTATSIERYKEMGNQANYQDYLNQALLNQNRATNQIAMEAAEYKFGLEKDIDTAIGGMSDVYKSDFSSASNEEEGAIARSEALKASGIQNIVGGATSGASALAMTAGSKGGGEGASYRDYKKRGGGMSRNDWRAIR